MQFQSNFHAFKRLRRVLGNQAVNKFGEAIILIVGVGGIGCEVLKNLSKFPLRKLVIIDLDVIELSNLNRQFYFRKEHLQQSKARVAKEQILKLVPEMNIEAIQGSIYDKKYDNYHFYSQFDLVISALDNMKARQHLARNCTRYGKVMIDAGTSGFNGQSYSSVRFVTSCHNCYPSTQEVNFAVCTIRTRPQRSIHCAVYAKNFYQQFFGQQSDDFLHQKIQTIKHQLFALKLVPQDIDIQKLGQELFDYLFCGQFRMGSEKVSIFLWQETMKLFLRSKDYSDFTQIQDNSMSLSQYAELFISSFVNLMKRKANSTNLKKIPENYDKDDEDCCMFVFSLTNLRIQNFKDQLQLSSKMRNLTNEQCRRMIGKLIPAIASTNSIAASLEINQVKEFFTNNQIPPKYMTISPFNQQKVSYSWLSLPNPQCQVCSPKNLYFHIRCNLSERTFEELQEFAFQKCFSQGRDVYCDNLILVKNINVTKISANKKKFLNFKPDLLIQNTLTVRFLPTSKISDLKVQIILIDQKFSQSNQNKFTILNSKDIQSTIQALNAQKLKQNLKYKTQTQVSLTEDPKENGWQEIQIE